MAADKPKTLAAKLAKMMGQCRYIEKRGYNDHHKYAYATEADVSEKVAPLFTDYNIMVIPDLIEKKVEYNESKRMYHAEIVMEFKLIDGDTGETQVFKMAGEGQDSGDKALFKAITGTQKYAYLKLLQIETGLDPENDKDEKRQADDKKGAQSSTAGSGRTNTPEKSQTSGSSQNSKPPASSKGNTQTPKAEGPQKPLSFTEIKTLALTIGWDLKKIMEAANHFLKKQKKNSVSKWNDLEDEVKIIVANVIRDRKNKTNQEAKKLESADLDPNKIPTAKEIADVIDLMGWDLEKFWVFVNDWREKSKVSGKIEKWDDLSDDWKKSVWKKMNDKLLKQMAG